MIDITEFAKNNEDTEYNLMIWISKISTLVSELAVYNLISEILTKR